MKKPYQIEGQRAVKRLEQMTAEGNPAVQMVLPMAEAMVWLKEGVGELIRQAGVQLLGLMMEEEVRTILRDSIQNDAESQAETPGLGSRIQQHFAPLGGVELELPQRASLAEAANFSQPPG